MTTTKRLSSALKKKLEASLENLTPRQAGRLFLIYSHEFDKKRSSGSFWDYPPTAELNAAWKRRVEESRKKGAEIEREEVALSNGFGVIPHIFININLTGDSELWRLTFLSAQSVNVLQKLLFQDVQSTIAAQVTESITYEIPRPLTWEEYNQAVEWYQKNDPTELGELANELTGEWVNNQGFKSLEVPGDFLEENSAEPSNIIPNPLTGEDHKIYGETEELRRKWVESEGEAKVLKTYFAGKKDRLEAWIKYGGSPEFNDSEFDQKADQFFDELVEKVKSGELEGGLCFSLVNLWGPVPARDWKKAENLEGEIPAWAALRSIWNSWLYDQGFFTSDVIRIDSDFPDYLEAYHDVEGALEGDRLKDVAKKFYLACRKKPWGAGLVDPKKINFADLGRFLCAIESPLLAYYAPNLGWVMIETFAQTEGPDAFLGDEDDKGRPDWYATLEGLRRIAEDFGFKPEDMGNDLIQEFYYPTEDPRPKRLSIKGLVNQMDIFRVSHRPFTYREKDKRPLPSFLGLEFYTPLEQAVKAVGEGFAQTATFKRVAEIISDEFFGGLTVLRPDLQERLENLEAMLSEGERMLNKYIDFLSSPAWNIDTTSLRLVKKGPDEESARILVGNLIGTAYNEFMTGSNVPIWLENGETFEQVVKRISGLSISDVRKKLLK